MTAPGTPPQVNEVVLLSTGGDRLGYVKPVKVPRSSYSTRLGPEWEMTCCICAEPRGRNPYPGSAVAGLCAHLRREHGVAV